MRCPWLLPLPLCLTLFSTGFAGERVQLDLTDGSALRGSIDRTTFPMLLLGTELEVPVEKIQRIERRQENVLLFLSNGDQMTGPAQLEALSVDTLLGKLNVPLSVCRTIRFPDRPLRVSDGASLLKRIASDHTIHVPSGTYDLSRLLVENPHVIRGPHERIEIRKVKNLRIIGRGPTPPRITVRPPLADTLSFFDCENIHLEHLSLGHVPEGQCIGGVLRFVGTDHITIKDCDLFGCGTQGVVAEGCKDILVTNSVIRDCTTGLFHLQKSERVQMKGCRFLRNNCWESARIEESSEVLIENCVLTDNKQVQKVPLFNARGSKQVIVRNLTGRGNVFSSLDAGLGDLKFEGKTPSIGTR